MSSFIKPGQTVGILGGGQLGRFLSLSANKLGYKTFVYCPEDNCPASQVSDFNICKSYNDEQALTRFIENVDIVTFEFENLPISTLNYIEKKRPIRPRPTILEIAQDRSKEKKFFMSIDAKTTEWVPVNTIDDLQHALNKLGYPSILKTSKSGYDGKGQFFISSKEDITSSWKSITNEKDISKLNKPFALLEKFVDFDLEISVIVSRDLNGNIFTFEPTENIHHNHILHKSIVPANISTKVKNNAIHIAKIAAAKLDLVGIMAIEMFVTQDEKIIINEMAPRPHNSGHWTLDASEPDQFTQQIKCVCGHKTIEPIRKFDATMINIIGDEINNIKKLNITPDIKTYNYSKKTALPNRKMGHITTIKNIK